MKNKIINKGIVLFGALAGILTSCTDPKPVEQYINVDTNYFSFMGEPEGTKTIKVEASGDWTVNTEETDSWLTVVNKTDNSLELSAEPNDTGFLRNTVLTVSAGKASRKITIEQTMKDNEIARYRLISQFLRTVISPNGKYAGGFYTSFDENGQFVFQPYIIDMATDEWQLIGTYSGDLFVLQDSAMITDDGQLFLTDGDHGSCIRFSMAEAGDYEIIPMIDGFMSLPEVAHSADNGNIWVGYSVKAVQGKESQYFPIKWINGVPEVMPRPELSYRNVEFITGVMARGCSLDGSIIYGTTWDNDDCGMVYWKDGKVDYVWRENIRETYMLDHEGMQKPYTLVDGMITYGMIPYQASASGKYLSGTFRTEKMDDKHQKVLTATCPAFFNTETKELFKITDLPGSTDGSAMCALDNGIGFIGTPNSGTSNGYVVEIETGAILGSIQEWIFEKYGIQIPNGYPNYISPDGSIILGTKPMGEIAPNWYVAPPAKK